MNWEALGAIGEIVGAAAVIVTLGYLAVQMRQNTRAVRAAAFQQVVDSFAEFSSSLSHDRELMEVVIAGNKDFNALNELDRSRYDLAMRSFMRRSENVFFQSEQGTLQAETWTGIRESLSELFRTPGFRSWWERRTGYFNATFRDFLERNVLQRGE
jgi:hypothetical protein